MASGSRFASVLLALLALCGRESAAFFPAVGVVRPPTHARPIHRERWAQLRPLQVAPRLAGACAMQMSGANPGLVEPPAEVVEQALANAVEVVKAAGGCIDSLSFGREWKEMFPDFPRETFKGTRVTSFNKLLSTYGTDIFSVEATKKQEVKLYILKDSAGAEGRAAYERAQQQLKEIADSPLGVFFDIRGGRMRAGGARALPPNLASYTKLDELLDALEPNLVAFAGGVSVVSAKDAVTALNNIKRLQYQARFPVQQSRAESFVRVFVDIATRGISTLSTKSIALLLNAIEAFSSDRIYCEKTLQAASLRIQTLAKGTELLASLPVLGDTDNEEVFTPQAVAVIVTAYQRMGLRDDALFQALTAVVKALPPDGFDAQALSSIANAYMVNEVHDADMFQRLAAAASRITADRWNPTAVSLLTNALVQAGMSELAEDRALLHQLAEVQCDMYASQGPGVFSSPGNVAKLLSALAQARVQHVRLFTCASVVVSEHLRLEGRQQSSSNLLLPSAAQGAGKNKGTAAKKKGKADKQELAARRFMELATGADLVTIAGALHDAGTLPEDLALALMRKARQLKLVSGDTKALAAAIRAFAPAAEAAEAVVAKEVQDFLGKSFSVLPAQSLQSAASVTRLVAAMREAGWADGAAAAKITVAICKMSAKDLSGEERAALEEALAALDMPRHLAPAIAHLKQLREGGQA